MRRVRPRRPARLALRLTALCVGAAGLWVSAPPALAAPACNGGWAAAGRIGKPAATVAWRAGLVARTRLWRTVPGPGDTSRAWIGPAEASWLLVLGAARDGEGRCWLRVRLPSRPNDGAAWVSADRVDLRPTGWRIVVSRRERRVTVYRDGKPVRRFRVVVGAASTPTPRGLFSIVGVWRWNPGDFLGSYILPITAHSNVLKEFGGGEGRVGLHGRGGSSLLVPLGVARSHGCVRLANERIEWIVRTVGADRLPGVPVSVR